MNAILKNKFLNEWYLFFLFSTPISVLVIYNMLQLDMTVGADISYMIGYAVRFAVPFIFIVAAASSFHILFPSNFSKWYLRNRKYIGLIFAGAMVWQGIFIFMISTFTRDYYFNEVYLFRDELEGTIGYIFLTAMIITSFKFGRKYTNSFQWNLIQKGGVYFLWAYAYSVYWWNLYYYPLQDEARLPEIHDHIFYWMGFTAFVLRIAAWGKKRIQSAQKVNPQAGTTILNKMLGYFLIGLGLLASASGLYWQKSVNAFLLGSGWSAEFELWFPFWPFGPFLSLMMIGLGTLFLTKVELQNRKLEKIPHT